VRAVLRRGAIRPPEDQTNFEGWVAARFGWRLYRIFFKTYTEKLWGRDATELQSDWAAQRIKNLSLLNAVVNAVLPKRNQKDITSLIEEFQYPKLGPGMMWERCAQKVQEQGGEVVLETKVRSISREPGIGATAVTAVVTGARPRAARPGRAPIRRPDAQGVSVLRQELPRQPGRHPALGRRRGPQCAPGRT